MGNAFTQSWIQALTAAADNPYARRIKPSMDLVNRLVRNPDREDRETAARELWDFAQSHSLLDILRIIPSQQIRWEFVRDDAFLFHQTQVATISTVDDWLAGLGITQASFELMAEVNALEWTTMIREQAVRKQQTFSKPAATTQTTLQLPCTATWDGNRWEVRFASPDWLTLDYEDPARVERMSEADLSEHCQMLFAEAASKFVRDTTRTKSSEDLQWQSRVPALRGLHAQIQNLEVAPRALQVWNAVWPVVYREQNVLGGCADLDIVRNEISQALKHQPEFTLWTFVFAKLVYQVSSGYGLGFLADFGLDE